MGDSGHSTPGGGDREDAKWGHLTSPATQAARKAERAARARDRARQEARGGAERAAQKASFEGITGGTALGGFSSVGLSASEARAASAVAAERAQQRSTFAQAEALQKSPVTLGQRLGYNLGTAKAGYVTAEEAETLGDAYSEAAAQARGFGLSVDVEKGTVSPTGFDASRAFGGLFGQSYTTSIGTFANVPSRARAAVASQVQKGTIAADPTSLSGYGRSTIGRIGEVASLGYAGQSFAQAAATAQQAAGVLGVAGAATPIGAAITAGLSLVGAVRSLTQLAAEDVSLVGANVLGAAPRGRSPSAPARGGDGGIGVPLPPTQPTTPTNVLAEPPPVQAPPRRRRPAGSGLASTVRTSFFGAPTTVRRLR